MEVKSRRVTEGSRVVEGSREPLSMHSINIIKATKKTKIIIRKSQKSTALQARE